MARRKMNPLLVMGIGLAAKYLSNKENREKAMEMVEKMKDKAMNMWGGGTGQEDPELMDKAGHPDPHDIEDNRMVAEGAQYSVDYYNKEEQQLQ